LPWWLCQPNHSRDPPQRLPLFGESRAKTPFPVVRQQRKTGDAAAGSDRGRRSPGAAGLDIPGAWATIAGQKGAPYGNDFPGTRPPGPRAQAGGSRGDPRQPVGHYGGPADAARAACDPAVPVGTLFDQTSPSPPSWMGARQLLITHASPCVPSGPAIPFLGKKRGPRCAPPTYGDCDALRRAHSPPTSHPRLPRLPPCSDA